MRKILVSEGALYRARNMGEWELNRFLCGLPTCDRVPIRDRLGRPALREEGLRQVARMIDLQEACNEAQRHPLFGKLSFQDQAAIKNDRARSWDRRRALQQLNIDSELVEGLQRYGSMPICEQLLVSLLAAPPGSRRRAAEQMAQEWLRQLPLLVEARNAVAHYCPPGVPPLLYQKARRLGGAYVGLQAQVQIAEAVLQAVSASQGAYHGGEPTRRVRVREHVGSPR